MYMRMCVLLFGRLVVLITLSVFIVKTTGAFCLSDNKVDMLVKLGNLFPLFS